VAAFYEVFDMERMDFLPVAFPQTESELAVMVSLLVANDIHHFVHNQGFGGLYPGLQIGLYNDRRIMVRADQAAQAHELLSVFQADAAPGEHWRMTAKDKVRVLFETLLFGWSFPSTSKRRKLDDNEQQ
jgi:hypothetical protein